MSYFDWFVLVAWTFAFAWFAGAIYVQSRAEKIQTPPVEEIQMPRAGEKPESYPDRLLPVATGSEVGAD